MTELVTRNYQWPEVTRDMGEYINIYQKMKNRTEVLAEKLKVRDTR